MAPSRKSVLRLSDSARAILPGSEKKPFVQPSDQKLAPPSTKITVSVIVRRKNPLTAANQTGKARLTRAQYRLRNGADPAAVKLVRSFAKEFGLTIAPDTLGPERRTIKLTGTVAAMQRAFGVTLIHTTIEGMTCRIREGSITLPRELVGPVEAVLGLDNRPQAQPHFRLAGQKGDRAGQSRRPEASPILMPPLRILSTHRLKLPSSTISPPTPPPQVKPSASSNLEAATELPISLPTSTPSAKKRQRSPQSSSTVARTLPPTPAAPTAR